MSGEPPSRVALVTGAADPGGIGAACARALTALGHSVVLLDRAPCDAVVAQLRSDGGRAHFEIVDLADAAALDDVVAGVAAALGEPTILVHAAADLTQVRLDEVDGETLARMFAVNASAAILLARRLAPGMRPQGFGRIVAIASDTFDRPPGPGLLAYIASKGALIGAVRALALELGGDGVTVNAISPGLTWTAGARGGQPPQHFDAVRAGQAIDRTLVPEDYAGLLQFLVSPGAAAITGQTLRADGGLVMM